jgi:hypothetical protein
MNAGSGGRANAGKRPDGGGMLTRSLLGPPAAGREPDGTDTRDGGTDGGPDDGGTDGGPASLTFPPQPPSAANPATNDSNAWTP